MYIHQIDCQEKGISLKSIFSVFQATYDSNYCFIGETHDFWEIVYVLSGEICVSADERLYRLTKGSLIFHKPMEVHKFHIENNETATLFIMTFSAIGPLLKHFENKVLQLSNEQEQLFSNIISFLHSECCLIQKNNLMILEEIQNNSTKFQIFVCMMEMLFLSLSDKNTTTSETLKTPDSIVFQAAIQAMDKRIHEWITVSEIAKECNVSVSYLKKIFAKHAGMGIHKYFLKQKIILASHMLLDGNNASEIASSLSFSSTSYFCTVFKREMGITPSAYKKKI